MESIGAVARGRATVRKRIGLQSSHGSRHASEPRSREASRVAGRRGNPRSTRRRLVDSSAAPRAPLCERRRPHRLVRRRELPAGNDRARPRCRHRRGRAPRAAAPWRVRPSQRGGGAARQRRAAAPHSHPKRVVAARRRPPRRPARPHDSAARRTLRSGHRKPALSAACLRLALAAPAARFGSSRAARRRVRLLPCGHAMAGPHGPILLLPPCRRSSARARHDRSRPRTGRAARRRLPRGKRTCPGPLRLRPCHAARGRKPLAARAARSAWPFHRGLPGRAARHVDRGVSAGRDFRAELRGERCWDRRTQAIYERCGRSDLLRRRRGGGGVRALARVARRHRSGLRRREPSSRRRAARLPIRTKGQEHEKSSQHDKILPLVNTGPVAAGPQPAGLVRTTTRRRSLAASPRS